MALKYSNLDIFCYIYNNNFAFILFYFESTWELVDIFNFKEINNYYLQFYMKTESPSLPHHLKFKYKAFIACEMTGTEEETSQAVCKWPPPLSAPL